MIITQRHCETCQVCQRLLVSKQGIIGHHPPMRAHTHYEHTRAECFGARKYPLEATRNDLGQWIATLMDRKNRSEAHIKRMLSDRLPVLRRLSLPIPVWTQPEDPEYALHQTEWVTDMRAHIRDVDLEIAQQRFVFSCWKPKRKAL